MSIWFMLVCAFCAFRAASPFTVAVAFLQIVFRGVQCIGLMLKKRLIAKIGYGLATICIIMMFFGAMVDQSHIISFF